MKFSAPAHSRIHSQKIGGKEKVAVHEQHVGFNVKKPYRNPAVALEENEMGIVGRSLFKN
ncbi:MAG: hypothetical protein DRH90_18075 [Deltaproteobacteria bacterium]|nr:MAG: hypothetical protein DRH90_18075 [Deltaproteobacteria bacterium]